MSMDPEPLRDFSFESRIKDGFPIENIPLFPLMLSILLFISGLGICVFALL